jgi:DNA polymerase III subunit beta
MKAIFEHRELDKAVSATGRVTTGKATMPILSGILISVDNGFATFTAGNNELFLQYIIPAQVSIPGQVVVSGRLFNDLIKKMPSSDISMTLNEENSLLTVQSGKAIYKILTMKANEYPEIESTMPENGIQITCADLRKIHRLTSFAVSKDTAAAPLFTGIDIIFKDEILSATGTDKKRLARKTIPFKSTANGEIIIPPDSLSEITRLTESEEIIRMSWDKGKICFQTDNVFLSCRAITGAFPADIDKVIPKNLPNSVTVNRQELLDSLDRVSLISTSRDEKYTFNTIVFSVQGDLFKIRSASGEKGEANEELATENIGSDCEFAFNGYMVLDLLKAIESEKVTFCFPEKSNTSSIIPVGDDSFIYAISPLRENMYRKE